MRRLPLRPPRKIPLQTAFERFCASVAFGAFFLAAALGIALLSTPILSAPRREKAIRPVRWDAPTDFAIQGGTILSLLSTRSELDGFSFLLDRRIDPSTPVNLSASSIPLIEGLARAVESAGLEFALIGDVFYVGPKGAAGTLLLDRAIRKDRRAFASNPAAERLSTPIPLSANDGCIPADLLGTAAKRIKLSWDKLDLMPFDCWRKIDVDAIPAEDAFSLLLIGFNVSWRLDDKRPILTPVPFRPQETVTRTYSPEAVEELDRSAFTEIEWTQVAGTLRADGPFEAMAKVEYAIGKERMNRALTAASTQTPRPSAAAAKDGGERLLSGEVRQVPLRTIFASLREQLGVVCALDRSAEELGVSLETRVSCRFDNADKKRALKILADALDLSVRVKGNAALFLAKRP